MPLIDFSSLTFLEHRHPRPYNNNRHSQIYHPDIAELPTGDPEPYSFIPLVLDPTPPTALPSASYRADTSSDVTTPRHERPAPSRTISNASQTLSELDAERDRYDPPGRKPVPISQPSQHPPPHIAYQEKGRQSSLPTTTEVERKPVEKQTHNTSTEANPYPSRTSSKTTQPEISISPSPTKSTSIDRCYSENKQGWDNFKLEDAPQRPDTASSASNIDDVPLSSSSMWTTQDSVQKHIDNSPDSPGKYSSIFSITVSNSTMDATEPTSSIPRKEVPSRDIPSEKCLTLATKPDLPSCPRVPLPTQRSNMPGHKFSHSEALGSSSLANALTDSPLLSLPLRTPGTDFSQDEDIARILGSDASSSALLRKVSSVVRHGRSFSDLAGMVFLDTHCIVKVN